MGGEPIDGVIVVDPYGLAALLEFTGPIEVDGSPETLTPDNAADILVRRQYVEFDTRPDRADFLDQASRKTFEKLTTGDIPGPERIGAVLGPAVQDKHLMFTATRPDEQAFLQPARRVGRVPGGAAGSGLLRGHQPELGQQQDRRVPAPDGAATSRPTTPAAGRITSKATVTLRNDAPASGLPDAVIGSNDRGLPLGTNRLLLSFYSPLDLVDSSVDGTHQGFESQRELGYQVYRRYIGIPPGGTVTVQLDLAGTIDAGSDYQLAVGVQPMVNPDTIEAIVHAHRGLAWPRTRRCCTPMSTADGCRS